jgi:hypothetical protein
MLCAVSMLDKSLDQPDSRVPLISDLDHVSASTVNLQEMIAKALKYVTEVTSGEREGDERIGRYLRDTVAAIPKVRCCERGYVYALPHCLDACRSIQSSLKACSTIQCKTC